MARRQSRGSARLSVTYDSGALIAAGAALAASGTRDVVDAAVVVAALDHGGRVVTSDPDDLRRIADALGRRLDLAAPKRRTARPRLDSLVA